MRVCLIFPPSWDDMREEMAATFPPHGLLCIAAYLEKAGHQVSVIDCVVEGIGLEALKERLITYAPDVVGISILSMNRFMGFRSASIVKKISSGILTVIGGVHATWFDEAILMHYPDVDIVVRGEGEETFLKIIEASDLSTVEGITFRQQGQVTRNSDRVPIQDIDMIPFPAFHLVPMERYFSNARRYEKFLHHPVSMIMTVRGCMAKCIYCSTPGMWQEVRIHSPEYVIENIRYLQRGWGIRDLLIYDDTFPISSKWFNRFHELFMRNNINITFRCLSRVNAVDEPTLRKLREMGCYFISYGIESGSERILKTINKGIRLEEIERTFALTHAAGIMAGIFLMVGFPGEELEDVYETLKLARSLKAYELGMAVTMLFPGSRLWHDSNIAEELWFREPQKEEIERFTFNSIPTFLSERFSREEMNLLALWITHQFGMHNFGRRFRFQSKTLAESPLRILFRMLRELATEACLLEDNPFQSLEKKRYALRDSLLRSTYSAAEKSGVISLINRIVP